MTRASELFRSGGLFDGVDPPGYVAGVGATWIPHWAYFDFTATLTTTATRLYYVPMYFNELFQFTGLRTYNSGAGDNGEVLRLGVYEAALTANGKRGLPSSLLIDCGEITLTGAAAIRSAANTFTPNYIGWHWLAYHANTAAAMYAIRPITPSALPINLAASQYGGVLYVDTTYSALASTAVAPTAITASAPVIGAYRT